MIIEGKLSIDRYLAACLQIEEIVGEIYRHWSQSQQLSRALRELCQLLEHEEQDHAFRVVMLRQELRDADTSAYALSDILVLHMVEYARSCLVRIRASRMPAHAALFLGIRMEERLARFHCKQSRLFDDSSISQLFMELAREHTDHCRQMQEIHSDFCQTETTFQAACHW